MVKVKEVMKRHVVTTDDSISISTAAKMMTNNKIGSIVVMKDEKPVDIITTEDIVWSVAAGVDKRTKIREVLKRKKKGFIYALEDDNLLDVVKKMVKTGVKRMPVLDKNKNLVGIISDKEVLLISPELIEVLSEKLKSRVESTARFDEVISGICEECGNYSDELRNVDGRWLCEPCIEERYSS